MAARSVLAAGRGARALTARPRPGALRAVDGPLARRESQGRRRPEWRPSLAAREPRAVASHLHRRRRHRRHRAVEELRAMRILWVKVGGLWPLNIGGRLRSFHIISELSQRHHVSVLTTHGPGEDPNELRAKLPRCERVVSTPYASAKRGSARFAAALARSWLSPLSVELWRWRIPALRRAAARLLAVRDF